MQNGEEEELPTSQPTSPSGKVPVPFPPPGNKPTEK